MNPITDFLKGLVSPVTELIGKAIPDKDLAANLNAQISALIINADTSALQAQSQNIQAEAKGESWLQRNWRPITMMVFVSIVANNYLIAPYIGLFAPSYKLILDTPPDLWALIKIGLGGYVVGRSGEKMVKAWANKGP